ADRRWIVLHAIGGALTLANETTSTSANRIVTGTGANVVIGQGGAALLVYDPGTSRWRVAGIGALAIAGSGGISVTKSGNTWTVDGSALEVTFPGDEGEVLLSDGNGGVTALSIDDEGEADEGKVVRVVDGKSALDEIVAPGVGGHIAVYDDRKSTRLNSSHVKISYAVFCLKKKKKTHKLG